MTALSDCLTNLHSEAGGAVELIVVRPVDAPDLVAHALAGDRQAIRIFEALSNASRAVQKAPKRKPLLCATCPRALRGTAFTFGIVLPRVLGYSYGVTEKANTVIELNVSPGASSVDGNSGWFGESGKCCVSRQNASP